VRDLNWTMGQKGLCAGASGQGFLLHKGHTQEEIPAFGDSGKADVMAGLVAILVP
jgi:hypothetical protein